MKVRFLSLFIVMGVAFNLKLNAKVAHYRCYAADNYGSLIMPFSYSNITVQFDETSSEADINESAKEQCKLREGNFMLFRIGLHNELIPNGLIKVNEN